MSVYLWLATQATLPHGSVNLGMVKCLEVRVFIQSKSEHMRPSRSRYSLTHSLAHSRHDALDNPFPYSQSPIWMDDIATYIRLLCSIFAFALALAFAFAFPAVVLYRIVLDSFRVVLVISCGPCGASVDIANHRATGVGLTCSNDVTEPASPCRSRPRDLPAREPVVDPLHSVA